MKYNDQLVKVYHRLLRYPVFLCQSIKTDTEKSITISNGRIIVKTKATVNDFENLLCIMYLAQKKKAVITETKLNNHELIAITVKLSELKKMNIKHDYNEIYKSIENFTTTTLFYDFCVSQNKYERLTLKPVFAVNIKKDESTQQIEVLMFKKFYDACIQKSLSIDIFKLTNIRSPYAKNLFTFIEANRDKNIFNIDTLLEKAHIDTKDRKRYVKLNKALQQLVKVKAIKSYKKEKNKIHITHWKIREI